MLLCAVQMLLGKYVGAAVHGNALSLSAVADMLKAVESCKPRRDFLAAAFKVIKARGGDAGLGQVCQKEGFKASSIMAADPEFDADEPPLEKFLQQQGLTAVPL